MAIALTYDRKNERTPRAPVVRARRIAYPSSDGRPMAETDAHVWLILYYLSALHLFLTAAKSPAYVAGNNFIYYEEGNPKARISPDTYVVLGVAARPRNSYKTWEENGRTPNVVFEFTSRKTKDEDLGKKFALYEQILKVPEYFLFDPTGDYLRTRLQGYRLSDGRYQPIPLIEGRMTSEQLHLDLVIEGERLRLFDPSTSRFLPTLEEAEAQRAEEARARAEAEAEVARLRAELAALRGEG